MENNVNNIKGIELIAERSREILDKQIASYRQKHTNAGTIIGIVSLFIPFFLNGLEDSYLCLKYMSIICIGMFVWALVLMLLILITKPLDQGISINKYDELVNKTEQEILLIEIGCNRCSFTDNKKITDKVDKRYNLSLRIILITIFLSVVLLVYNKFDKPEANPLKVKLENPATMQIEFNKTDEKPVVIPIVPPSDRERLTEDTNPKPQTNTPKPK